MWVPHPLCISRVFENVCVRTLCTSSTLCISISSGIERMSACSSFLWDSSAQYTHTESESHCSLHHHPPALICCTSSSLFLTRPHFGFYLHSHTVLACRRVLLYIAGSFPRVAPNPPTRFRS